FRPGGPAGRPPGGGLPRGRPARPAHRQALRPPLPRGTERVDTAPPFRTHAHKVSTTGHPIPPARRRLPDANRSLYSRGPAGPRTARGATVLTDADRRLRPPVASPSSWSAAAPNRPRTAGRGRGEAKASRSESHLAITPAPGTRSESEPPRRAKRSGSCRSDDTDPAREPVT